MTIKLTAASFLAGVRQSGLVEPDRFEAVLKDMEAAGVDGTDSRVLADALVERKVITPWQSEKLLQGRHKGFILGRYKLLNLLGAGEMSAVFLAQHTMMDRYCAIKVLPGNKVQDSSYLGRFYREAKAVAALNHPNIVRAFDVDRQMESGAEIHFLVMEYVEGKNLEQMVLDQQRLDYTFATDVIRQAADGLAHAHQAGLVHRDVKPGNFLVDKEGTVKLLDLGLARFFKANEVESLTIKHDEKVLGTADYLAPEQAIDSHSVDARADIYSLGCTFYYLLLGHPPFTDGSLVQRLLAHQTRKPPAVRDERDEVPESLTAILDKMMAKKPSERYQTAAEVSEALALWLIDHAGDAWKKKHVALFAQLVGIEKLSARLQPATTSNTGGVNLPSPTQTGGGHKSSGGKSNKQNAKQRNAQLRPEATASTTTAAVANSAGGGENRNRPLGDDPGIKSERAISTSGGSSSTPPSAGFTIPVRTEEEIEATMAILERNLAKSAPKPAPQPVIVAPPTIPQQFMPTVPEYDPSYEAPGLEPAIEENYDNMPAADSPTYDWRWISLTVAGVISIIVLLSLAYYSTR